MKRPSHSLQPLESRWERDERNASPMQAAGRVGRAAHESTVPPGSGISWRSQRRHQSVARANPSAARIVVAARFTFTGPAWLSLGR